MQYPTQTLIPELIPRSSWFQNLRSLLSQEQWDTVRKASYRQAGYRCEICGGKEEKWPVECHERWSFDDAAGIQYLEGVIALCPMCHKVKHIGLSELRGEGAAVLSWMSRVNGWPIDVAVAARNGVFVRWEERSRKQWKIDYSRAPYIIQQLVRAAVDSRQVSATVRKPSISTQLLKKIQAAQQEEDELEEDRITRNAIKKLRMGKIAEAPAQSRPIRKLRLGD